MKQIINISSNGIKQAIDDLVNENELLQDKVYKLEEENKRLNNIINQIESIIYADMSNIDVRITIQELLDKELKGSESNE